MTTQSKAVAIYARVSTDKQKVDMQLNELRELVNRTGWEVYKEFIDEGYTGSNTKRPAFTEMISEALNHSVQGEQERESLISSLFGNWTA